MLRVVFMGTPDFAVPTLNALKGFTEIVAVYTQPDRPVGRGKKLTFPPIKKRALELSLNVFQPEKLTSTQEVDQLKQLEPDVVVVVAYGQILKKDVLLLPKLGCVNIHSSLLPRWRGAAPIQRAILSGDKKTGITTMFMAEKLDAGDILLQSETEIKADDTSQTLHDRLADMGAQLIQPTLEGLKNQSMTPIKQDETKVTYAKKLDKKMQWLNPEDSSQALDLQVRALNPWPGTSVIMGNNIRLKVIEAKADLKMEGQVGLIFEKYGMVFLGTSSGSLQLLKVQQEGKKVSDISEFMNGLKGRGLTLPIEVKRQEL